MLCRQRRMRERSVRNNPEDTKVTEGERGAPEL